jgi:hypothetical protein
LLQSIYGQFTEGFGTPDLIHAEALLEGLRPNSLEKVAKNRLTWSRRNYLRSPRIVAARLSRLKSKARPAERHLGVLWKPQRFIQLRIVKNVGDARGKANADHQRREDERHCHHLQVGKAAGGGSAAGDCSGRFRAAG